MGTLTDAFDIQRHAEILTEHAHTADGRPISVTFKKCDAPHTISTKDSIKLVIPEFNSHMSERDMTILRGWIAHEIGHHTEGHDIFDAADRAGIHNINMEEDSLSALMNCFEDNRIERKLSKRYRGDAIALSETRELFLDEVIKKNSEIPGGQKKLDAIRAAMGIDMESRQTWMPADHHSADEFYKTSPPEVQAMMDKLRDANYADVLRNMETGDDVIDAAKKAFELLIEEDVEEHIKDMNEKAKQQGKGKGDKSGEDSGEGDAKGADSQVGKGRGTPQDCNGEKESGFVDAQGQSVKYKDFLQTEHDTSFVHGGTGIHLDYTDYKRGEYQPCPLKNIGVAWWNKGTFSRPGMEGSVETGIVSEVNEWMEGAHRKSGKPGHGFGNKIRRLLQIKSQAHYIGGHKKGRLHKKTVYKVGCPKVGDGSWNERVFKQKHTSDVLDVAVTILVDFSGSMYGYKTAHAIDSALLLNESIATSLRIPVEVLGFTEYRGDCMIGVAKEFDERINEDKLTENLAKTCAFMSNNADGEAIQWAYLRLKARHEKRKILIVLSDGSPAATRPGDAMSYTKKVVKEIEDAKLVEILGIGIMDRNVKLIYSDNEAINEASELENAVLNVIKRKIIV